MREKLIELLAMTLPSWVPLMEIEGHAEDLLANGVTVQEWISVTERLPVVPDEELDYWVDDKGYPFIVATEDGCVEVQDFWVKGQCFDYNEVTHWMPLPEPPKEG